MELVIKVTLKPEPELGEYKGLHVEKQEAVVTDEDVDAAVNDLRNRNAKMVAAEEGAVIEKGYPTECCGTASQESTHWSICTKR